MCQCVAWVYSFMGLDGAHLVINDPTASYRWAGEQMNVYPDACSILKDNKSKKNKLTAHFKKTVWGLVIFKRGNIRLTHLTNKFKHLKCYKNLNYRNCSCLVWSCLLLSLQAPTSFCSPECPQGYARKQNEMHRCCFTCEICPNGTYINATGAYKSC